MNSALLDIQAIDVNRAESQVLHQVSLTVNAGECVSIIGSNGAGKSTLIETILNLHPTKRGRVLFEGNDLALHTTTHLASLGIAWVPEGRRLFTDMSVEENIVLGQSKHSRSDTNTDSVLDEFFPHLKVRKNQLAGTLSGGEQQMVAIARAVISKPKLLLIDEMSIGLSPKFTLEVFKALDQIRKTGVSILIVEQNIPLTLKHSDRAYILEQGRIVMTGTSSELLASPRVQSAYLGV